MARQVDPLYDELNDRETRVIRIHPSKKWSNMIQCDMYPIKIDVPLSGVLDFQALSYTWGTLAAQNEICINGEVRLIPPNLDKALRNFRQREIYKLWVDYLCINQQSLTERSIQVSYMASIYRDASRVLVWIDDSDEKLRKTLSWIKSHLHPGFVIENQKISLPPYFKYGMNRLSSDIYWHRMWTAQEFALSHDDPIVIVGDESFEAGYLWPALEAAGLLQDMNMLLTKNGRLHNANSSRYPSMQTSILIRSAMMRRGQIPYHIIPSLGLFLCLTWARECNHPHDKIFALYGLFANSNLPKPDYHKSYEDVVAGAIAYVVNVEKDLDIFGFLALTSKSSPSWLPDLSNGKTRSARCLSYFMTREICSATNLALGSNPKFEQVSINLKSKTLNLSGITIDQVEKIIVFEKSVTGVGRQFLELKSVIQSLCTKSFQKQLVPHQSLWQTLFPRFIQDKEEDEPLNQEELIKTFCAGSMRDELGKYMSYSLEHMHERHFFITFSGVIGIGPPEIRVGDELCLMSYLKLPVLLRKFGFDKKVHLESFKMIGSAYVSGLKHEKVKTTPNIESRLRSYKVM